MGNVNSSLKMRKILTGISLCILLISVACSSTNLMAQNNKNEIAKIENTVNQLYSAMVEKDKSILQELTMEELTYGHSSGTIENQSEYVNGVLNGTFQFSSITPVDQTVSTSGNVGIVRHIFEADGTNNGRQAKVRIGCLLLFQKEGQWKLLARQAYKL